MQIVDKNLKILIATAMIFAVGIGVLTIKVRFDIERMMLTSINQVIWQPKPAAVLTGKATLIIDFGEGEIKTLDKELKEEITAFDLLKITSEELNLSLETKTYDIGILVESIGYKKNGQDGKYWLYYVNNEMPMVAADKKEIGAGDKVEFKFEEPSF